MSFKRRSKQPVVPHSRLSKRLVADLEWCASNRGYECTVNSREAAALLAALRATNVPISVRATAVEHCSSMGSTVYWKYRTHTGELRHSQLDVAALTGIDVREGGEIEVAIRVLNPGKATRNPWRPD